MMLETTPESHEDPLIVGWRLLALRILAVGQIIVSVTFCLFPIYIFFMYDRDIGESGFLIMIFLLMGLLFLWITWKGIKALLKTNLSNALSQCRALSWLFWMSINTVINKWYGSDASGPIGIITLIASIVMSILFFRIITQLLCVVERY